jgi:hypothetical protein
VKNRFSCATTREVEVSFGVLFKTTHPSSSFMDTHRHPVPYVSILIEGSYTELRKGLPEARPVGALVFHPANEVHADYFPRVGRCLNIALPQLELRGVERPPELGRVGFGHRRRRCDCGDRWTACGGIFLG